MLELPWRMRSERHGSTIQKEFLGSRPTNNCTVRKTPLGRHTVLSDDIHGKSTIRYSKKRRICRVVIFYRIVLAHSALRWRILRIEVDRLIACLKDIHLLILHGKSWLHRSSNYCHDSLAEQFLMVNDMNGREGYGCHWQLCQCNSGD